ncbi:prepilin-type N-terminal cleavage/methylation domain-containing protein [Desulfacinum infernum DSM 9756]|uniref:Prepilin-type N-terminal cleavage/methylation domain-containing protein n=2 Tax=Desulfacinum infernum TaxID=35837 RepID=A0A1M5DE59_9BACT|nr:prepilin-type N-terminal cleavage/methylation domain-containing protein [Desulfacinum infernum]SHF65216.1 prepilin-type N-terminal cleavage/methylation domain-containing protein [Desulfacinum infernum DSM 9756]
MCNRSVSGERGRACLQGGTRGGFTLVEVLVSLLVLGVALMALWGFHWTSRQVNLKTKREASALVFANQQLETFRSTLASGGTVPVGTTTDVLQQGNVTYTRVTNVAQDGTFPWRLNVTVTVQWAEQRGGQGQTVLRTILVP